MESNDAVKLAYIEFQKDFDEGEETNQWLKNVIDGLKQAEKELQKPQELYNKIKEKRDNAKLDLEINHAKTSLKEYHGLFGQIAAYNDILCLMESMFEVEENDK